MGKSFSKKKCILASSLVVLVLNASLTLYEFLKPLSCNQTTYLYIDNDDNTDSVRAKMEKADADISTFAFNMMSTLTGYGKHIQPGRYELSAKRSTLTLFRSLMGHASVPVELVLPSVRTTEQLAGRLASQLMVDSTSLAQVFGDSATWKAVGRTCETFPALFIPNTYEVYWETSPEKLMQRLDKENKAFWTKERKAKATEAGLTEDEVVTLASIVDSETADNSEKARIAGLYINRMNRGLLLQSDPTVIFAIGDFSIKRVSGKMLETDSPYNTYKEHGLPPGPICIPSIAGIDAVLNYEHNDYLYMCAKEDFSGSHNFAETFPEHMANARRYTKALNALNVH